MNKKYDEKLTGTGREKNNKRGHNTYCVPGIIDPRLKIAGMTMVHSLLFLSCFLFLFSGVAEAATLYWVGNAGVITAAGTGQAVWRGNQDER